MNKAIFLDKDGTLIPDIPYNVDMGKISLSDNCADGLKLCLDAGYRLIVVSNQSGIAYGYFTEEQFAAVTGCVQALLAARDVVIDAFYYCPHHSQGIIVEYSTDCYCRKPMPGMLLHAAEINDIDLSASWMIGDILNDVEAGNRAGCRTILLDNGNETEWVMSENRKPAYTVKNFKEAADLILRRENSRKTSVHAEVE